VLEAPADQQSAMLQGIAKALAGRLLQENQGIGIRNVFDRVTAFIAAVLSRLQSLFEREPFRAVFGVRAGNYGFSGLSGMRNPSGRASNSL
jgi:hypothetical protein